MFLPTAFDLRKCSLTCRQSKCVRLRCYVAHCFKLYWQVGSDIQRCLPETMSVRHQVECGSAYSCECATLLAARFYMQNAPHAPYCSNLGVQGFAHMETFSLTPGTYHSEGNPLERRKATNTARQCWRFTNAHLLVLSYPHFGPRFDF